jgi:hypothetical protein
MRVATGLPSKTDDWHLLVARQMGCEEVVLATPADLPGDERWEYEDLVRLRTRVESFGLKIRAIQNTPARFINEARLGLQGGTYAELDAGHYPMRSHTDEVAELQLVAGARVGLWRVGPRVGRSEAPMSFGSSGVCGGVWADTTPTRATLPASVVAPASSERRVNAS